jgi:hypothetical protein
VFFENSEPGFPFELRIEASPSFSGGGESFFSARGGLAVQNHDFAAFEKKYPFTQAKEPIRASSDWAFDAEASVPFSEYFWTTASLSFRQTAFGKGIPVSDFSARDSDSGLFRLMHRSRTAFDTALGIGAGAGMFNADFSWGAFWLDSAANGDMTAPAAATFRGEFSYERIFERQYPPGSREQPHHHCLSLYLSLTPESGKWGAHAGARFFIDDRDVPFVGIGAFYRFGRFGTPQTERCPPQVSLAVEIQDALKFVTAEKRIYASPYIASSGGVTVFLRFSN